MRIWRRLRKARAFQIPDEAKANSEDEDGELVKMKLENFKKTYCLWWCVRTVANSMTTNTSCKEKWARFVKLGYLDETKRRRAQVCNHIHSLTFVRPNQLVIFSARILIVLFFPAILETDSWLLILVATSNIPKPCSEHKKKSMRKNDRSHQNFKKVSTINNYWFHVSYVIEREQMHGEQSAKKKAVHFFHFYFPPKAG